MIVSKSTRKAPLSPVSHIVIAKLVSAPIVMILNGRAQKAESITSTMRVICGISISLYMQARGDSMLVWRPTSNSCILPPRKMA